MLEGQDLVIDQLVKVIQAIQMGRATGSLVAMRGEGPTHEVGTIVFLKGKVVQAKVGRREDREALNWLSTWGRSQYTFVLGTTSEMPEGVGNVSNKPTEPPASAASTNEVVPYRSQPLAYGLRLLSEKQVSRTYRHLYLLVDGARTVGELQRLLRLEEYAVLTLLYDLQDLGIISMTLQ